MIPSVERRVRRSEAPLSVKECGKCYWLCAVVSPCVAIAVAYLTDISDPMGETGAPDGGPVRWSDLVLPTDSHAIVALLLPASAAIVAATRKSARSTQFLGFALGLSVAWSSAIVKWTLMATGFFLLSPLSGEVMSPILVWAAWGPLLACFAMHRCATTRVNRDHAPVRPLVLGGLAGLVTVPMVDLATRAWPSATVGRTAAVFDGLSAVLAFVWCAIGGVCIAAVNANRANDVSHPTVL